MIYVNQTGKKSVFRNVMCLYLGKKLDNLAERGERTLFAKQNFIENWCKDIYERNLKSMKYLGGWGVCEIVAKLEIYASSMQGYI